MPSFSGSCFSFASTTQFKRETVRSSFEWRPHLHQKSFIMAQRMSRRLQIQARN